MNDTEPTRFRNFEEFWPFYVLEHQAVGSRRLHFVGTLMSFAFLVAAALLSKPILLLGALVFGYGLAWAGHFFLEHNRPATFKHPLYSLLADYRMFGLMLNGRMQGELDRIVGPTKPVLVKGAEGNKS